MTQVPSLGRIVIYQPSAEDQGASTYTGGFPAIVTRVWSNTCVNLFVIREDDLPVIVTSVVVAPEGEEPPPRSWRWPART